MNKQELIKELKEEKRKIEWKEDKYELHNAASGGKERAYSLAIDLAKQLDEMEKVVVPKFVAEWLDKHKYSTDIIDLFLSVEYATDSDGFIAEKWDYSGEFYDWLNNSADVQFTLCDAMRYGYEVEKEPLYYVKFDILYLQKYLVKNVETNQFYLSNNEKVVGNYEQVRFTEQEIKAIDERYWPFAVKVDGE
ncbi:DUF1642 domain-containing protein [Enterococcus faecalis]|uniref:DUF1642 domain-containing protein n=1 Tax=Enterococcus faecalis TaxID=1351 RepID=UPI0020915549|nr:DUF1642 domain-containing protein [Enterococcus faecalis]MCO5525155.1 DUF1642 domain-containing protein [Enterococcus faecalis]